MGSHFQLEGVSKIKVSGDLDEFYPYEELFKAIKPDQDYTIDLGGVGRMNSCGVREWIRGLMGIRSRIVYQNCPGFIVDQISLIPQLLPPNVSVESFQAMFSCVDCDNEQVSNYEVGKDYFPGDDTVSPPENQVCKSCGGVAEFSHNHDTFFSFLAGMKTPA